MESSVHQLLVHGLWQTGGELCASATSAWLVAEGGELCASATSAWLVAGRWRALCHFKLME